MAGILRCYLLSGHLLYLCSPDLGTLDVEMYREYRDDDALKSDSISWLLILGISHHDGNKEYPDNSDYNSHTN